MWIFSSVTRILCCELSFDRQGVVQHIHSVPHRSHLLKFWQKYFLFLLSWSYIPMITAFCVGFHIRLSFSAECLIPCIYFNLKHLGDPRMLLNNPPPWGEVPGPGFHISAGPLRTLRPLFSFPAAGVSHSFTSSLDPFQQSLTGSH